MAIEIFVVGLGYVGLPLAVAFDNAGHRVTGYDISAKRLEQLACHYDATREISTEDLQASKVRFTGDAAEMATAQVIVVTVPTPVTHDKKPDLSALESACRAIGTYIQPGTTVVFESTVYPGVTEEFCGPIIAEASGLVWRKDFWLGYSPERINPGDRSHTIDKIVKIIAGDRPETTDLLDQVYGPVTSAGTYRAESIKVAEAAKVIENTQRDLNIALMNELSIIFDKLAISTPAVLAAAGTKWNFQPFRPGLVGGHCIGVDPYYLTHCAERLGYHPQVILAGRRTNDDVGARVADKALASLAEVGRLPVDSKIAVLGLTFKEDVPDTRNSLVFDVVARLKEAGADVAICDPVVEDGADFSGQGIRLVGLDEALTDCHLAIIAVGHRDFMNEAVAQKLGAVDILLDLQARFPALRYRTRGSYWAL